MSDQRGFALLAVLLVLALLGVVVSELSASMRLEASMVRSYKESVQATHLAEAAIQQAMREILGPGNVQALDKDGTLVFLRAGDGAGLPVRLPTLPRQNVALGAGEFSYRISDEESRINLNNAPPDRILGLLSAAGIDKVTRDIINDSLQDWKDPDELRRLNGAESEDFYLRLPVPYRARNGPLQDTAELLQIRGVTREIYQGSPKQPGLADLVTVTASPGTANMNTAPEPVLRALGFLDAEISDIVGSRVANPYTTVPGRYGGRGLAVSSATFRIEAEGRVSGQPRARIVAIVQRRAGNAGGGAPTGTRMAILSWRPADQ